MTQRTRFIERTYIDLALAGKPAWAKGCGKCVNGLIDPPPVTCADTSVYLVRVYQAANERLTFCDCEAGQAYRQYLKERYEAIRDGLDHVPNEMSQALTDAVTTPTVHFEVVR